MPFDSKMLTAYPEAVWQVLVDLAPYFFIGLFLAGVIEKLFPESRIRNWFGRGKAGVLRSALAGIPLPLCSCGVVPVALSLRRRGASRGATVSFLITTPQSGVDSIAATWGLMGAPFAILRTILTFFTGLVAGFLVNTFDKDDDAVVETGEEPTATDSQTVGGLKGLLLPGWQLLQSIVGWLIVGILLAALVDVAVPDDLASRYLSPWLGMLTLAVIALPLYVCATASIPLAMEFVDKGFTLGAAFVFLLVGPATNLATMLIVRQEIGNRSVVVYIGSIVVIGLLAGLGIDALIAQGHFNFLHESHEHGAGLFSKICAGVFAAMLLFIYFKGRFSRTEQLRSEGEVKDLTVKGMTCEHCRKTVHSAVEKVPGVIQVSVDLANDRVSFEGGRVDEVRDAVQAAGFQVP